MNKKSVLRCWWLLHNNAPKLQRGCGGYFPKHDHWPGPTFFFFLIVKGLKLSGFNARPFLYCTYCNFLKCNVNGHKTSLSARLYRTRFIVLKIPFSYIQYIQQLLIIGKFKCCLLHPDLESDRDFQKNISTLREIQKIYNKYS